MSYPVCVFSGMESNEFFYNYEGKDPNVDTIKSCGSLDCRCAHENKVANNICSRCLAVFYCSRECQTADFSEHKKICKQISKAREKASALEIALRGGPIPTWDENHYVNWSNQRIDYFNEKYLGNWWGHLDPRDYCRAVWKVTDLLLEVAWDYECEAIWEECLNLKLELLRNNVGDNQGIRHEVPEVLLYLNRDDDCVKFIKWWAYNYEYWYKPGYGAESDANLKKLWQKGEFIYNETGDVTRFDDIYPMFDEEGNKIALDSSGVQRNRFSDNYEISNCLDHLIALVCIKMRVVAHLEAQQCSLLKLDSNADITNIATKITVQIKLLDKYLHMAHKHNKYILHVLSSENNIRKMREQGRPEYYGQDTAEEAFLAMEKFMRCIARAWGLSYIGKFLAKIGEFVTPDLNYKH